MKVRAVDNQNWREQEIFINSSHKHPLLVAGLGFGKTNSIPKRFAKLWCDDISKGIESPYLFNVGLKASHNEDVIRPEFESFFSQYDLDWTFYPDRTKYHYKIKFNGHLVTIKLLSAERPEKIVGFNATHGNIDELDVLTFTKAKELWVKCLGRTRKVTGATLSATTTPEGFKFAHWLCERSKFEDYNGKKYLDDKGYEVTREPVAQYIQASTFSNPTLGDDYIETLRRSLDPLRFEAYTTGKFINFSAGQVFPYFKDDMIQSRSIIGEYYTFWDFGWRNMMYVGFAVVTRDHVHVYDEIGKTHTTTDQMCKLVTEIRNPYTEFDYCDPAGEQHHSASGDYNDVKIMREHGFNPKSKQSTIVSRIRLINNLIAKGRFTIDPKCKHLIDSMRNSVYPEPKNGVYDERPLKDSLYDHARDALGYFLINRFQYEVIRV
jgi:hypothetical protein